jgi:hypothetical protein
VLDSNPKLSLKNPKILKNPHRPKTPLKNLKIPKNFCRLKMAIVAPDALNKPQTNTLQSTLSVTLPLAWSSSHMLQRTPLLFDNQQKRETFPFSPV